VPGSGAQVHRSTAGAAGQVELTAGDPRTVELERQLRGDEPGVEARHQEPGLGHVIGAAAGRVQQLRRPVAGLPGGPDLGMAGDRRPPGAPLALERLAGPGGRQPGGRQVAVEHGRAGQQPVGLGDLGVALGLQEVDGRRRGLAGLDHEVGGEQGHAPVEQPDGVHRPGGPSPLVGPVEPAERGRQVAPAGGQQAEVLVDVGGRGRHRQTGVDPLRLDQVRLGHPELPPVQVQQPPVVVQLGQEQRVPGAAQADERPPVAGQGLAELSLAVPNGGPLELQPGPVPSGQRRRGPVELPEGQGRLTSEDEDAGQVEAGLGGERAQTAAFGAADRPGQVLLRPPEVVELAVAEPEGPLHHRPGRRVAGGHRRPQELGTVGPDPARVPLGLLEQERGASVQLGPAQGRGCVHPRYSGRSARPGRPLSACL
jgi:hypothetical protein